MGPAPCTTTVSPRRKPPVDTARFTARIQDVKGSVHDPSINDTLGWMLVQANAPQRGLAFLRNAHSRAGFVPTILYHIAVALHRLERNAEARRELESALASKRPFAERTAAQALLARIAK